MANITVLEALRSSLTATKKYVDDRLAEVNASGGYVHPDNHPASMITGLATVATSGDYNNLTNKPITILTAAENEFIILSELAAGAYLITGLVKCMSTDTASQSFNNSFFEVLKEGSLTYVMSPFYISIIDSDNNSMESVPRANMQADWNAVDTTDPSYINNKPTIPTVTNDLTNELKANYDAAYAHSKVAHAPSNAQKNSDITKAEIEAKLTGNITSHTHNQYLTSIPAEYITEAELNAKGYALIDSPDFTSDVSMGRKAGTTVGESSVALGVNVTASGGASHAEGAGTTASGELSHAEGMLTIASRDASHAEGYVTTASGACQHVQGKYNIKDTTVTDDNPFGTYAHIVGNGYFDTNSNKEIYSNAHTLDWNGNGWYAGKVTVGTAPTENMDVATKQYVDDKLAEANASGGYTHPASHPASMITGLATVATSGSYNDLSNKPTIPSIPSSLPANGGNADTVNNFHLWKGTQAEYDAITTKNPNTIYFIKEG